MAEYPLDDFGIDFIACDCTVWPIVRFHGSGRCGRCGVFPDPDDPARRFGSKSEGQTLEKAREEWQRKRRR